MLHLSISHFFMFPKLGFYSRSTYTGVQLLQHFGYGAFYILVVCWLFPVVWSCLLWIWQLLSTSLVSFCQQGALVQNFSRWDQVSQRFDAQVLSRKTSKSLLMQYLQQSCLGQENEQWVVVLIVVLMMDLNSKDKSSTFLLRYSLFFSLRVDFHDDLIKLFFALSISCRLISLSFIILC